MGSETTSAPETRQTFRYIQVAAIGALLLIAAILYTFTHVSAPDPVESYPAITFTKAIRQKLPQFEWSNGQTHLKSADLQGSWTLLTFWSSTCAPCLRELPDLDQFAEDWSGPELNVISVNMDPANSEAADATKQFLAESEIQLPVYYDPNGELKKIFGVEEIPRHFLIDPQGEIVWQARGAFNWSAPETEQVLMKMIETPK